MQGTGCDRTDNRTSENRFPYATELPKGRRRHTNQRFFSRNRLELEEIDGKIERKIFANYFSTLFSGKIYGTTVRKYCFLRSDYLMVQGTKFPPVSQEKGAKKNVPNCNVLIIKHIKQYKFLSQN